MKGIAGTKVVLSCKSLPIKRYSSSFWPSRQTSLSLPNANIMYFIFRVLYSTEEEYKSKVLTYLREWGKERRMRMGNIHQYTARRYITNPDIIPRDFKAPVKNDFSKTSYFFLLDIRLNGHTLSIPALHREWVFCSFFSSQKSVRLVYIFLVS